MADLSRLNIKIGINPIVWSNDDMQDLGGDIPLDQCLSETQQAGYSGIELGHKFPKDTSKLKPILNNYNLKLVSGWHSTFFASKDKYEEIENFKKHLSFLKSMECKVIICAECTRTKHSSIDSEPRNQKPLLTEEEWKSLIQGIDESGKIAKENGLKLVYHHHIGTCVETMEEVDRFMKETNPDDVWLLADTGHMLYAGGIPLDLFTKHRDRIAHIHFKDIRKDVLEEVRQKNINFLNSVKMGVFTVPGDGCIDYGPIIEEINKLNYDGWIVVEAEQDPKKAIPLKYANKAREFIKAKIGI